MTMTTDVEGTEKSKSKPKRKPSLKAIAKSAAPPAAYAPSLDDPRAELRRLVFEHKVMMRKAVSIEAMYSPRKNRTTGEVILCRGVADDRKEELRLVVKGMKADAKRLEGSMVKELRKLQVYDVFLRHVFGVGPVVASYLIAELDPRVSENHPDPLKRGSTKPSQWRRFCGLAVIDGRLERSSRGEKNHFSKDMRTRLYQAFSSMWKNAAKNGTWIDGADLAENVDSKTLESREKDGVWQYKLVRKGAPHGVTSKYLTIWTDYRHRMAQSERILDGKVEKGVVVDGKIVTGAGKTVSAKGHIHVTGWKKAADVFIEDLYIVWRAIEGLPVWPSYYAAKLGYEHGGKVCVEAPKMITVDEALALVGNVGPVPRSAPVLYEDPEEDEIED